MWTTAEIAGKSADVLDGNRPRFAVLFLHDLDQKTLGSSQAFTAELQRQGLACVCPHGKRSWWLDRVCPEFDPTVTPESYLLQSVVPFVQQRWGLEPRRIALLGIGMGGQGAIRLALRYPKQFPVVAGIA